MFDTGLQDQVAVLAINPMLQLVRTDGLLIFQIPELAVDAGGLQRLILFDCDHAIFAGFVYLFVIHDDAVTDLQSEEFFTR